VETRLQEMRAGLPQQEFEQQLAVEGATLAELKAELRRDIAIRRLFEFAGSSTSRSGAACR
jgi:hypothetical protein